MSNFSSSVPVRRRDTATKPRVLKKNRRSVDCQICAQTFTFEESASCTVTCACESTTCLDCVSGWYEQTITNLIESQEPFQSADDNDSHSIVLPSCPVCMKMWRPSFLIKAVMFRPRRANTPSQNNEIETKIMTQLRRWVHYVIINREKNLMSHSLLDAIQLSEQRLFTIELDRLMFENELKRISVEEQTRLFPTEPVASMSSMVRCDEVMDTLPCQITFEELSMENVRSRALFASITSEMTHRPEYCRILSVTITTTSAKEAAFIAWNRKIFFDRIKTNGFNFSEIPPLTAAASRIISRCTAMTTISGSVTHQPCFGFLVESETEPPGSTTRLLICLICKKNFCSECREESGCDDGHVCNTNTIESLKSIRAASKPCPHCSVPIIRSSGCPDMFCTHCHTCFNWNTLRITKSNTNPLFREWLAVARGERPAASLEVPFVDNQKRVDIHRLSETVCGSRAYDCVLRCIFSLRAVTAATQIHPIVIRLANSCIANLVDSFICVNWLHTQIMCRNTYSYLNSLRIHVINREMSHVNWLNTLVGIDASLVCFYEIVESVVSFAEHTASILDEEISNSVVTPLATNADVTEKCEKILYRISEKAQSINENFSDTVNIILTLSLTGDHPDSLTKIPINTGSFESGRFEPAGTRIEKMSSASTLLNAKVLLFAQRNEEETSQNNAASARQSSMPKGKKEYITKTINHVARLMSDVSLATTAAARSMEFRMHDGGWTFNLQGVQKLFQTSSAIRRSISRNPSKTAAMPLVAIVN
jgi:hypothetical protein